LAVIRDRDWVVRRVRPDDWQRLRALRLEALKDTPMGFLERYEDALRIADDRWQYRARRGSENGDSAQFVAERGDGSFVGTMLGFPDAAEPNVVWLAAVYVSPSWRGRERAVADALLDAVLDWARDRNASRVLLEVHEDNAPGRAFYRRRGFIQTGQSKPYPLDPSGIELLMALPLSSSIEERA
jgi:ribosomal protein S18 acetylase RimI-like enzyme